MKKRIIRVFAGFLMACTLLTITTCNKQDEEDTKPIVDNPDGGLTEKPEEPDADYVYVDGSIVEDMGEWDAAIFGKDGTDYYYKFQENNLPKEFVLLDRNNKAILALTRFYSDGLPSVMTDGEYTLLFLNYRGNRFDLVLLHQEEVIL
ncbi:MAG: hypothetical protein LBT50_04980 [Prevotellaceae bacterium]|jgi:hypothetical protein|nr:hypothetical protein [Prevotellaceae bacterium]